MFAADIQSFIVWQTGKKCLFSHFLSQRFFFSFEIEVLHHQWETLESQHPYYFWWYRYQIFVADIQIHILWQTGKNLLIFSFFVTKFLFFLKLNYFIIHEKPWNHSISIVFLVVLVHFVLRKSKKHKANDIKNFDFIAQQMTPKNNNHCRGSVHAPDAIDKLRKVNILPPKKLLKDTSKDVFMKS